MNWKVNGSNLTSRCCRTIFPPLRGSKIAAKLRVMSKDMGSAWKQLDQYVDLYKFHWDLCIKLNLFTLGISGAMSAYVLKNQGLPLMEYALFLPILLSAFMASLASPIEAHRV